MKKAFAWLEGNGIEYRFHDYKKEGLAQERIAAWLRQARWDELVNKKGKTFRQLPPERQEGLNAARAAELMQAAPSIVKRPIIETGRDLVIGFDPERYRGMLTPRSSGK